MRMTVARINDDKVRCRQLGLDPRRTPAVCIDVEAQRG